MRSVGVRERTSCLVTDYFESRRTAARIPRLLHRLLHCRTVPVLSPPVGEPGRRSLAINTAPPVTGRLDPAEPDREFRFVRLRLSRAFEVCDLRFRCDHRRSDQGIVLEPDRAGPARTATN